MVQLAVLLSYSFFFKLKKKNHSLCQNGEVCQSHYQHNIRVSLDSGSFCQHIIKTNRKFLKSPQHFNAKILITWISKGAEAQCLVIGRRFPKDQFNSNQKVQLSMETGPRQLMIFLLFKLIYHQNMRVSRMCSGTNSSNSKVKIYLVECYFQKRFRIWFSCLLHTHKWYSNWYLKNILPIPKAKPHKIYPLSYRGKCIPLYMAIKPSMTQAPQSQRLWKNSNNGKEKKNSNNSRITYATKEWVGKREVTFFRGGCNFYLEYLMTKKFINKNPLLCYSNWVILLKNLVTFKR